MDSSKVKFKQKTIMPTPPHPADVKVGFSIFVGFSRFGRGLEGCSLMVTAIKQYAIHDNRKILPTGNFIHTEESNGKEKLVKLDVNYNYICKLFISAYYAP